MRLGKALMADMNGRDGGDENIRRLMEDSMGEMLDSRDGRGEISRDGPMRGYDGGDGRGYMEALQVNPGSYSLEAQRNVSQNRHPSSSNMRQMAPLHQMHQLSQRSSQSQSSSQPTLRMQSNQMHSSGRSNAGMGGGGVSGGNDYYDSHPHMHYPSHLQHAKLNPMHDGVIDDHLHSGLDGQGEGQYDGLMTHPMHGRHDSRLDGRHDPRHQDLRQHEPDHHSKQEPLLETTSPIPPPVKVVNSRRAGRKKIPIDYIADKSRRHVTFSKRKAGIMKKAKELSTLTGTQILLLVASENGHIHTYATPKLEPLVMRPEGKNLLQACLNAGGPREHEGLESDDEVGRAAPSPLYPVQRRRDGETEDVDISDMSTGVLREPTGRTVPHGTSPSSRNMRLTAFTAANFPAKGEKPTWQPSHHAPLTSFYGENLGHKKTGEQGEPSNYFMGHQG